MMGNINYIASNKKVHLNLGKSFEIIIKNTISKVDDKVQAIGSDGIVISLSEKEQDETIEKLEALAKLLEQGKINQDEFKQKKVEILGI